MKTITVNKDRLLETLKTNRAQHERDFEDARRGYLETLQEKIAEMQVRIEKGELVEPYFNLEMPVSYVKEYDRAIQMMEWHEGATIELAVDEFTQYVQDEWRWKQNWQVSNVAYLSKVRGV